MKRYQVNINHPDEPIWQTMTKEEFVELWQLFDGQWEEMVLEGAVCEF